MHKRWLVVSMVVLAVACKSESKDKPTTSSKTADGAKETWSEIAQQPRTAMAAKTAFLELTIELPPSASTPVQAEKETTWTFKDSKLELLVHHEGGLPTENSLKGAKMEVSATATREFKEEPGAYGVVDRANDGTGVVVAYCRNLDPAEPPSGICCRMQLRSDKLIADRDKLIAFGEQVCRSIKVTNRKVVVPTAPAAGSAQ